MSKWVLTDRYSIWRAREAKLGTGELNMGRAKSDPEVKRLIRALKKELAKVTTRKSNVSAKADIRGLIYKLEPYLQVTVLLHREIQKKMDKLEKDEASVQVAMQLREQIKKYREEIQTLDSRRKKTTDQYRKIENIMNILRRMEE